jgi:hypothetical protein
MMKALISKVGELFLLRNCSYIVDLPLVFELSPGPDDDNMVFWFLCVQVLLALVQGSRAVHHNNFFVSNSDPVFFQSHCPQLVYSCI